MFNNDNLSKLYKKIWFLIIISTCTSLIGCNDFIVNENISGKKIVESKYYFWVLSKNTKKILEVKYHNKSCSVLGVAQNKNKTLTALKIDILSSKKYITYESIKN